jgi:hypothetical protein
VAQNGSFNVFGGFMSKLVEIGYLSTTDKGYSIAIRKVKTLNELKEIVAYYRPIAEDAYEHVVKLNESDFEKFLTDLKKAPRAKGKTAERIVDEWGDIIMPAILLKVSLTAIHFHAPFGTAYIRMKETGTLYENPELKEAA